MAAIIVVNCTVQTPQTISTTWLKTTWACAATMVEDWRLRTTALA